MSEAVMAVPEIDKANLFQTATRGKLNLDQSAVNTAEKQSGNS
jgi:hypothetical protein